MPDARPPARWTWGPADAFGRYCDAHPDRARGGLRQHQRRGEGAGRWVVTSSVGQGHRTCNAHAAKRSQTDRRPWAPTSSARTGADMLLWQGSCVVHDEFGRRMAGAVARASASGHPGPSRIAGRRRRAADGVGSTTQLIAAAGRLDADTFIVATDQGILHDMRQRHPGNRPAARRRPWRDLQELRAMSLDGDERDGRGAGRHRRRNCAGSGCRAPAHRTHAGFRRRGSPAGAAGRLCARRRAVPPLSARGQVHASGIDRRARHRRRPRPAWPPPCRCRRICAWPC